MLNALLTLLATITAIVHIRAEYAGPRSHIYVFKPATTSLIILIALLTGANVPSPYKWLVITGLVFSLAGDVFLMLPTDQFIAGLISFLIAHLLYIAAFVTHSGVAAVGWLIPLLVYGGIIYYYLAPYVGKMRIPVIVYMIAILVMAWQAVGRWRVLGDAASLFAAIGAVLFVISDSALAVNRFRRPFPAARLLTMTTYYLAQWFIAQSIGGI